jgi:hypothetical protein
MEKFLKKCKERLFNSKSNIFCFFLFLAAFIYGIVIAVTYPFLGGGDFIIPVILCAPFIVNIIGSLSNNP